MTIQEKVQAVLVGDAGITALVDASKIKSRDTDQQNLGQTYIIHEAAGGSVSNQTHEAIDELLHWPAYQVHCCAPTLGRALAIAAAVKALLSDYGRSADATFRSMFDGDNAPEIDDERKVVDVVLDFDIWEGVND